MRFFTPSAYAFAIWAPIFLGELLLTFYQLGSGKLAPKLQPYLARLAPPLAQAFAAQSLWCVAFRPWVGRMQFVPSALLALTAVGLARVHTVLREAVAAGAVRPVDYLLVHLPLSLHFGWVGVWDWHGWMCDMDPCNSRHKHHDPKIEKMVPTTHNIYTYPIMIIKQVDHLRDVSEPERVVRRLPAAPHGGQARPRARVSRVRRVAVVGRSVDRKGGGRIGHANLNPPPHYTLTQTTHTHTRTHTAPSTSPSRSAPR